MRRLIPVLLLTAACAPDWTAPAEAVRFDPPPEYRVWWEASRACVNRREWVRYEQVTWYVTPERLLATDGELHGALVDGTAVYLWERNTGIPWVIQHELVHAIARVKGHPWDPFWKCNLMGVDP